MPKTPKGKKKKVGEQKKRNRFEEEMEFSIRAAQAIIQVPSDQIDRVRDQIFNLTCSMKHLAEKVLEDETVKEFNLEWWTITDRWMKVVKKRDEAGSELPGSTKVKIKGEEKEEESPDEMMPDGIKNVFDDIRDIVKKPIVGIYVMENVHFFMNQNNPEVIQSILDIAEECAASYKTLVMITPTNEVPPELESLVTIIEHTLPSEEEIDEEIEKVISDPVIKKNPPTKPERHQIIRACKGMNVTAISNALSYSAVKCKRLSPEIIMKEKVKAIRKSGALEYIESDENFARIGGLESVKKWLQARKVAFTDRAKKFNLRMPRGVLVVGPPGTGKTLLAKGVANALGISLIRFDFASTYNKYVGESEANMKKNLKILEAAAPCVAHIDEIEKALPHHGGGGGTEGGGGGGGVEERIGGMILTWLSEKTSPVFVVATSNNLDVLPVEYVRKGRFDEIFFVDIPTKKELKDIFRIQFERQFLNPKNYDLDALVKESGDFTGAEVERAIEEAKIICASEDRDPSTEDVAACCSSIIPEAHKNEKKVTAIRTRAAQIALPAGLCDMPSKKKKIVTSSGPGKKKRKWLHD